MANTYSAGIATAYGAAVRGGYTGTYDDFCRQQAEYAESAAAVEQAKADAETAADAAEASKTAAAGSASAAATSAGQASTSATNAANSATAANASKNAAATSATEAGNFATAAAGSAATAQGVLESIPPSYDDLTDEVADLKEDLTSESKISAEVYEENSGSIGSAGNIVLFFPIKAGETYTVKNTGVSGMSVFSQNTKGTTSGDVVEQISNWIAASGSVTWTASYDAKYIRAYCIGQSAVSIKRTGTIIDEINSNVSDLQSETSFIKSKIISGYDKETQTMTITDESYYSAWDGSVGSYVDSERTDKISVSAGDVYFISGTYHNAVALIVAYNSSNAFVAASSVLDTGSTVHDVVDYKYTVPSGITKIAFSSFTDNGRGLTVKKGVPIYAGDASEEMYSLFTSKIGSGYWKDKKIVWYGTSIPEGGYPQIVGELLGANVINEAVGTSRVHFKYPITPTEENPYCFGTGFKAAARTMSNTLEEQEWIIDNWNSNFWTADKPDAMTEELAEEIRSYSYENKIGKYLTDETFPDLFVFDHGHNDTTGTLEIQNQYYSQYGEYNLYTFRGAMNFLIKQILGYNPKARIVMIGEYTGTDSDFVPNMQLQVAHDWNIPICKQWERLGWTKTKSITVNAHWVKIGSYYYWTPDSTAHTMTVFDSWVPDGTHPIFDGSGRANNFIATSIAKWLDNEVNLL